jgi:predicted TIM-barrel fold metal-dependent hydrolase
VSEIDLQDAEVVDAHCHPYRIEELLARDPATFETRNMFLGTALLSSHHAHHEAAAFIDQLTDSTVFGLALRRWLAEYLGCEPTKAAVAEARDAAFRADPAGYARGLLQDERIVAVFADEGYPQPTIAREEFQAALGGVTVHRVGRLEPWILRAREEKTFDDAVAQFEAALREASADPHLVAYKTIIAYRTGLDVTDPPSGEAAAALERWRADGWAESRAHAKPVRDFLFRRALAVAREVDRPIHVHVGGGDPDIDLAHARPQDLFPLLVEHQDLPVVLIHAGYPWVMEAAYVASVLPNVYLEISELVPWGFGQVDAALEAVLGAVPGAKVLHGSDEASEPEMFWVSARLVRGALERVLGGFVGRGYLTSAQAESVGRGVLSGNVRALHGV